MYCDYDALAAGVAADPDDDAPRLVLADWFDENGDPVRAELIRVQVGLDDLGPPFPPDLLARERDLLRAHGRAWQVGLPSLHGIRYEFVRGFPVVVANCSTTAGLLLGARVPPPPAAGLVLSQVGGVRRLFARPEMRFVRQLEIRDCRLVRDNVVQGVAESANLDGLVRLGFPDAGISLAIAPAIAASPSLGRLRALDLTGNHLVAEAHVPGVLLAARTELNDLNLSRTYPRPDVIRAWAADPALARLRILRLNFNHIGDAGAAALAASPHLTNVWRLGLRGNGITATGAAALADSPTLRTVKVLDLEENAISAAVADRLRARFGPEVRLTR